MNDYVVLVNDENEILGTAAKHAAHNAETPLHRGFSVFLFNKQGLLLLQKRNSKKKTWPGVWTNSCCGHPMLNESSIKAANRRLSYELNINDAEIFVILPKYRYRFEKDSIVENELCPVMVAVSGKKPRINTQEVEDICFTKWDEWVNAVKANPKEYSPWAVEETLLLNKNMKFSMFLNKI